MAHSCDIRFAPVTPSTAGVVHLGHHRQPAAACVASVPADPSITHISHSGRRRSSGSDAMWPQISRQLAAAARRGQPDAVQVPVDVEVLVLHPHRMVEVQRAVGELLAELRHRLEPQRQFASRSRSKV